MLESAGIETLVLRDSPRPGFDVPLCLSRAAGQAWHLGPRQLCSVSPAVALDPLAFQAEEQAVRGFHRVHLIDLTAEFCDSHVCALLKGGFIVYQDSNHLAATSVDGLAPVLARQILPLPGVGGT